MLHSNAYSDVVALSRSELWRLECYSPSSYCGREYRFDLAVPDSHAVGVLGCHHKNHRAWAEVPVSSQQLANPGLD
jgi:hypothetical protein